MKQKRIYQDYQEDLIERLKDPSYTLCYLRAALLDKDERIFLLAIEDVFRSRGVALDFID